MKKKYLFTLLIIAIMFLFVSCNNLNNKETTNEETEIVTQTDTKETETATIVSCTETIVTETDYLDTTQTDETQETTKVFSYFDQYIRHQPTEEQMELIHKGMTYYEVNDIIGAPHMLAPDDYNGYGRVWVADNGDSYCLQFSLDKEYQNCIRPGNLDSVESKTELYDHLILDEDPYIVKTRIRNEYSSKTASFTIDGVDYYPIDKHPDYYITEPYTEVSFVRTVYKIFDGQPIDVTDNLIFYEDFFDTRVEHQPTIEEINTIHEGMTYKEVEAILGRPHRQDCNNSFDIYIWVTIEGNEYALKFYTRGVGSSICYRYSDYTRDSTLTVNSIFFPGVANRIKTQFFIWGIEYETPYHSFGDAFCTIDGVSYYPIEKHSKYYLTTPSTVVDKTCTIYKIIDNVPVDVTDDCDWTGLSIANYWGSWQPKCD